MLYKLISIAAVAVSISLLPCGASGAVGPYSMGITFDGYTKAGVLTDFPTLVVLNENRAGFEYSQFSSPTGDDLRFYDTNGIELNYEIEAWNTAGDSLVWVQVPSITGTNTRIEAKWGNSSEAKPVYTTNGATWSSDYLGVYHLHANANDSTSNGNDGVYENDATAGVASQIANGIDLQGGAHVDLGGGNRWDAIDTAHRNAFTLSCWVKFDTNDADQAVFGRFGGQFLLWRDIDVFDNYVIYDSGGPRTPEHSGIGAALNTWQYVTAVGDGTTLTVYVDGQFSGQSAGNYDFGVSADKLSLGTNSGDTTGRGMDGSMDEARIAAVPRSEDWIWASWKSQGNPEDFAVYDAVTPEPATLGILALGGLAILRKRRKQ